MGIVFKADDNNASVLGIVDESGEPKEAYGEDGLARPLLGVMSYVWDPDALTVAKMTQPQTTINVDGDFTATVGDLEALSIGNYFKDVRYAYDGDGNCIYKGQHVTLDASTALTTWYITKYEYDGDNNCTQKRFRITSWDDRALGW